MSRVYLKCQLKHLPVCVLIKVYRLDSALEDSDRRSKFRRGTCAKWEIKEERGTSRLNCQHLIRSVIKRFVTAEAEERGRAAGWMQLCPPCSEPRHQLSAVLIKKVICRIKPATDILIVDQGLVTRVFDFHVLRPVGLVAGCFLRQSVIKWSLSCVKRADVLGKFLIRHFQLVKWKDHTN